MKSAGNLAVKELKINIEALLKWAVKPNKITEWKCSRFNKVQELKKERNKTTKFASFNEASQGMNEDYWKETWLAWKSSGIIAMYKRYQALFPTIRKWAMEHIKITERKHQERVKLQECYEWSKIIDLFTLLTNLHRPYYVRRFLT